MYIKCRYNRNKAGQYFAGMYSQKIYRKYIHLIYLEKGVKIAGIYAGQGLPPDRVYPQRGTGVKLHGVKLPKIPIKYQITKFSKN